MNRRVKTIQSISWTSLSAIVGGLLGPVSYIFKARFLSPEEMGVLAVIIIITGFFIQIISSGFSQAIVEVENLNSKLFSSFYFVNIISALFFVIVIYLASPFIAQLYEMEELTYLLRLSSIQLIFVSLGNPYKGVLQKIINFKLLSIIDIFKAILLFLTTIYLLFLGNGLLSVIYANLVIALIGSILLIGFGRKCKVVSFKLFYNNKSFKPFIYFLKYYSGKLSLNYLSQNIDSLIIGLFLSDYVLGLYFFAKNLIDKFRTLLTNSLTSFLFPFFAKMKNDIELLKKTYLSTLDIMSLISFIIPFFIFSIADSAIELFFDKEWVESIIVFKILSLTMVFTLITNNISTSILYARGRVKFLFYLDLLSNLIFILLLYYFSRYGLIYVLLIKFFFTVCVSVIIQITANTDMKISYKKLYIMFFKRFLASFILAIINYFIVNLNFLDITNNFYQFSTTSSIFLIGYISYLLLFENKLIFNLFYNLFKKKKNDFQ